MTKEELISFGSSKVRNDRALLSLYFEMFKEEYGYQPQPPCCGNMADWDRFVKSKNETTLTKKYEIMNPEFEIKDKQKIYTYTDAKGIKRRCGGYNFTIEFASAYLTNGTDEEIELRKKEFKVLPNLEPKEIETTESNLSISQLKELYPQFAGAKDKKTLLKKIAEYESSKELDSE